ncbi:laminin subunit alpha-5 isoform X1, partial [Lates japonicus]
IVVSLVNGRPGAMNFSYSPVLREFTKATNIRLRFLRTNTLLGHLMGKTLRDPTVTRRYYYSIEDISIGGAFVANMDTLRPVTPGPNDLTMLPWIQPVTVETSHDLQRQRVRTLESELQDKKRWFIQPAPPRR